MTTTGPKFPDDMDPACVPTCEALCALPGVETTESCEGHGSAPPMIYFRAQSLAALHPITRAIDRRYYAYSADRLHCVVHDLYDDWWLLRVMETDLIDDRIRFCLTMRDIPVDAAHVLALLAQNVIDAARQLAEWEVAEGRAARLRIMEEIGGDRRIRVMVALPGVATLVVGDAAARSHMSVTNLGPAAIYLGSADVSPPRECHEERIAPGECFEFSVPPTCPLYAIAEDPPPRAVRPIDDDADGAGEAEEHVE